MTAALFPRPQGPPADRNLLERVGWRRAAAPNTETCLNGKDHEDSKRRSRVVWLAAASRCLSSSLVPAERTDSASPVKARPGRSTAATDRADKAPRANEPAQLPDSARAIPFIRARAAAWNIDPRRIACTGGSAGAGISLWLAFPDDLAGPRSADPVARQSTRLTCALPTNMQCTSHPREIKKIVPANAYDIAPLKQLQGLPATFNWDRDPIDAARDARLRDCCPFTHLTKDDPPVFAMNSKASEQSGNIPHPNFGRYAERQMDALGLECEFHLTTDLPGPQGHTDAMLAFLKKNFGRVR